jgi:hypothetical protein
MKKIKERKEKDKPIGSVEQVAYTHCINMKSELMDFLQLFPYSHILF